MIFDRKGEVLWNEWDGHNMSPEKGSHILYYTHGHVNVDDSLYLNALASAVQRDGISDSIGRAMIAIQPFTIKQGFSGHCDGGRELHACDEHGVTYYGEVVDEVLPTTWIEVDNSDV